MNPINLILTNSDLMLFWPMQTNELYEFSTDEIQRASMTDTAPSPDVVVTNFDGYVLNKNIDQLNSFGIGANFEYDGKYYILEHHEEDISRPLVKTKDLDLALFPVKIVARCYFPE